MKLSFWVPGRVSVANDASTSSPTESTVVFVALFVQVNDDALVFIVPTVVVPTPASVSDESAVSVKAVMLLASGVVAVLTILLVIAKDAALSANAVTTKPAVPLMESVPKPVSVRVAMVSN